MSSKSRRPYTLAGAGALTATIWKEGDEPSGWTYRFNVVHTSATGRVTQRFHPRDLRNLVKLVQVLAFTLADDGCLECSLRQELSDLAERLRIVMGSSRGDAPDGSRGPERRPPLAEASPKGERIGY